VRPRFGSAGRGWLSVRGWVARRDAGRQAAPRWWGGAGRPGGGVSAGRRTTLGVNSGVTPLLTPRVRWQGGVAAGPERKLHAFAPLRGLSLHIPPRQRCFRSRAPAHRVACDIRRTHPHASRTRRPRKGCVHRNHRHRSRCRPPPPTRPPAPPSRPLGRPSTCPSGGRTGAPPSLPTARRATAVKQRHPRPQTKHTGRRCLTAGDPTRYLATARGSAGHLRYPGATADAHRPGAAAYGRGGSAHSARTRPATPRPAASSDRTARRPEGVGDSSAGCP
jgi:hypothetical protein